MRSEEGTVYMIRGGTDHRGADDEWRSPAPADEIITEAIVETTDLATDDIDDIDSYVDADALRAVIGDGSDDEVTFDVEDHTVTVGHDGSVTVE